jgi:tripartite-type tricarboxylate transporter receptor subunit TctC
MPVGLYVKKEPIRCPTEGLVKMAKAKPNTLKVGIGGTWVPRIWHGHYSMIKPNIKCIRVPFSGGGPETVPALLGGHTDFNYGGSAHWAELYKAGKLNVLAVTTEQRLPQFPEIPTFKENGYDLTGLLNYYWIGAPANTPDGIVNYLAEAFKKGFAEKGYIDGMANQGCTAAWEGPAGALKSMDKLDQLVQQVAKKYNLKPE